MRLIRQRLFSLAADGSVISIGQAHKDWVAAGKQGNFKTYFANLKNQQVAANAQQAGVRQAQRAVGKTMQQEFQAAAKKGGKEAVNVLKNKQATQGAINFGKSQVGIMGGLKNTFNNAGKLGKAGMIGAGVAGTALLAKGAMSMFKGNKNQQPQQ